MNIALITDTHFGIKNDSPLFYDYFDLFLDKLFFPEIERRGITKIIHLGDVFDRRKYINYNTLTWARKSFFDRIKERGIKLDIIIGNHDCYFKNINDVNSPNLLLQDYSNIKIYNSIKEVDGLLYVPWINSENKVESLNKIRRSKSKILLGHLEIKGYTMFKGAICDGGMSSDLFEEFDLVLSGHFHAKNNARNIYYLGCPWDLIFPDVDDVKGFHVLETETQSLEFVANPYKLFNKLYYDDSSVDNVKDVLYSKKKYASLLKTFVKVYIKSKINPIFFDRYCEKLTEANPYSVIYAEEYLDIIDSKEVSSLTEDALSLMKQSIDDYSDLLSSDEKKSELQVLLTDLYIKAMRL